MTRMLPRHLLWILCSLLLPFGCADTRDSAPVAATASEVVAPSPASVGDAATMTAEDIIASMRAVQWAEAEIVERLGLQPGDGPGTYIYDLEDGSSCPVLAVLTDAIHVEIYRQQGRHVVKNPDATAGLLLSKAPTRKHELDPGEDARSSPVCRDALTTALQDLRAPR